MTGSSRYHSLARSLADAFLAGPWDEAELTARALVFTALSPAAINLFGSLVYALVLPYVGVGLTLLYLDLRARQEAG